MLKIHTPKLTNIILTDDVANYLNKKLQSFDKLVDPRDESAMMDVELGKTTNHHQSGDVYRTELNLHCAGCHLRAEAEASDIFASIDLAKDEMMEALRSKKGKDVSLLRRSGARIKNVLKGIYEWRPGRRNV